MDDSAAKILLVDDQAAKLMSYKAVLDGIGETLLTAGSAREAFEILLKNDIAVVLIDVCMPETDGFELAAMIREHPRFERTALIFISAVVFDEVDRLRGYEMGAVDYVSVPVIPEVLRAKVKVFVELYRKTKQLEQFNRNLEARVAERTAALAASTAQLRQAEQLRSLALAAGQMGSWEWDAAKRRFTWDLGQYDIFGVDPAEFRLTVDNVRALIHPDDTQGLVDAFRDVSADFKTFQTEFRVRRPNGELRWCLGVAAASFDEKSNLARISGVTVDVTDRKRDEQRQILLAKEVDHRARNVVTVIQAIMRLTEAPSVKNYVSILDGRISALSTAHKLLADSRWEGADLGRLVDEEVAPYQGVEGRIGAKGPNILLPPPMAQTIALALHELITNAVKYGALSVDSGRVRIEWSETPEGLNLVWAESGGPKVTSPSHEGYGMRVIKGGVEGQQGGATRFVWRTEGLLCAIAFPYEVKNRNGGDRGAASDIIASAVASTQNSISCILLVEDEPLISMMLADMLSESGHKVDGPHSKLCDALAAARSNELCGGFLDVNLRGEAVYPIADVLEERGIPFVFVTGYAADNIEARFNHIPVLQKPIEMNDMRMALTTMRG